MDTVLDKTAFSHAALDDTPDERAFWWSKSPAERLAALETMRQILYGYDPASARLSRVLEVAQRR